ncbi:ArsR/SmtB family transcription factor [Thiomicrorhabdus cannonii]|uniref:ArsR/SmtB family transcription factor n=1 Tax=Thiomicrorhabdus cannonii TaxID=2748011 RepID=UPI0015B96EA4|nr:metalloregulator ArsR/SmtB family transcription factor [Thiomicrorhabdus cannonii]
MNTDLNHNPQLEALTQTFKALSEPVRLRIVHLLLQRDNLCVCDLTEVLALNQSTVSRHLATLKNANVVRAWREGTWMHYAIQPDTLSLLQLELMKQQLGTILADDLEELATYEQQPRKCSLPSAD